MFCFTYLIVQYFVISDSIHLPVSWDYVLHRDSSYAANLMKAFRVS